jgi:hypothetical protein
VPLPGSLDEWLLGLGVSYAKATGARQRRPQPGGTLDGQCRATRLAAAA